MSASAAANRRPLPGRRLYAVALLAVGIIVAGVGLGAWQRREAVYASYGREMTNLGIALAEQTTRSLQAVDLVLRETQAQVIAEGVKDPEQFKTQMAGEAMHWFIARHSKNLPQAATVGLIGSDGTLVNGSRVWPTPQINVADRDYFIYLRDHEDAHVVISQPVRERLQGVWTFFMARRIDGPHGELLGMAVAGVDVRYFENFYGAITMQPGGSIGIFSRDGTMLARYPHAETMMGRRLPEDSPWFRVLAAGGGSYHSPGVVDNTARMVQVQPLRDYPLVVSVTTAEDVLLGEWRRQLMFVGVGAVCMAIAILILFAALVSRSRRLEQHNAELADLAAALRQSEARFRDFALTSSDWFWETDENHRFIFQSDEVRAFGQDPQQRMGLSRIELAADAASEPEKWKEHRAVLERHDAFRDFVYARSVSGEPARMISVSGRPLVDPEGGFLGYRGTARDITEEFLAERQLREAKAAAEAANHAKTQFLANVSHELRTPLNAILGFSEMLEMGIVGQLKPKQVEYLQLIRQSGNHLHEVINDILDFAKVDAGKLDLHDEEGVDPRRVVEACFAIVRERARLGGLQLSAVFCEPLPLLVCDETRLKQILLNLLSNAVKFTDSGGAVVLAVSRTGEGDLAFAVRDTGTGMAPDEIEIAMEPFGQVDGGLARRHEGTGLGLPLARRLAELHGGFLSLESTKGEGTVATLVLPAGRVMHDSASPQLGESAAAA